MRVNLKDKYKKNNKKQPFFNQLPHFQANLASLIVDYYKKHLDIDLGTCYRTKTLKEFAEKPYFDKKYKKKIVDKVQQNYIYFDYSNKLNLWIEYILPMNKSSTVYKFSLKKSNNIESNK